MPNLDELIAKRHALIPGAAHTYSKGDDQFPENAPRVILKGKGAYVQGSDGKEYLDWCMGLRSVSLGHVNDEVNEAVIRQMGEGTNFGRPHISEYVLAERLISILDGVEMVKFAKNGSTVTTAATKLARAYTGRRLIASCAQHPFFSYDDWFIGTTPCSAGIPEEIKKLTATFKYNDLGSVEKIFAEHPSEIACLIMEVITTEEPAPGFLEGVQSLCRQNGTVFILDEMITGFRWSFKGAAPKYNLQPDLVTYGKGIANGYSVAVLGGKKEIMQRGGIQHPHERVFLISTTHGAETVSLAAALATLEIMERDRVQDHFWRFGAQLQTGLQSLIERHGLGDQIAVVGFPPNLAMTFKDKNGESSQVLRTLFLQEAVKRGILFQGYFAISHSHGECEIKRTLEVFDEALREIKIISDAGGDYAQFLNGQPCKPVFRQFN